MKIALFGLGIILGLFLFDFSGSPVTFRSLESVTETGAPVYNRVRLLPGWSKDVWLMNQSHEGLGHQGQSPEYAKWDRLKIVVDKTTTPYKAEFYQLEQGALIAEGKPVPLKARCYACHANGPRAIRPNFEATEAQVDWL